MKSYTKWHKLRANRHHIEKKQQKLYWVESTCKNHVVSELCRTIKIRQNSVEFWPKITRHNGANHRQSLITPIHYDGLQCTWRRRRRRRRRWTASTSRTTALSAHTQTRSEWRWTRRAMRKRQTHNINNNNNNNR